MPRTNIKEISKNLPQHLSLDKKILCRYKITNKISLSKILFTEGVLKTLSKMASKFLVKSLRCKLSYQVLFLTSLRNN